MYIRQNGQVNPRENQTTTFRRPRYAASSTGSLCTEVKLNRGAGRPTAAGSKPDDTVPT
jgi:hypothetical protein